MTSNDDLPPRPPLPVTPPPAGVVEHADTDPAPAAARLADLVDARDRLAAQVLVELARVRRDPAVLDGLSPQVWLEQACRFTRAEARRLLATADTLAHLPAVVQGLQDGRVSWSQAQAIGRAARDGPCRPPRRTRHRHRRRAGPVPRLRTRRAGRPGLAHRRVVGPHPPRT